MRYAHRRRRHFRAELWIILPLHKRWSSLNLTLSKADLSCKNNAFLNSQSINIKTVLDSTEEFAQQQQQVLRFVQMLEAYSFEHVVGMFAVVFNREPRFNCEPFCFVLGSLLAVFGMQLVLSLIHGWAWERLKNVISNLYISIDGIMEMKVDLLTGFSSFKTQLLCGFTAVFVGIFELNILDIVLHCSGYINLFPHLAAVVLKPNISFQTTTSRS